MTERNEQGFVKDIKIAIEAINQEDVSFEEKIRKLINLPFSTGDVLSVNDYINQATNGTIDCNEELYNIAILNEQILEFDETLKSQLEKRHDKYVEALMNRMEGVFKMYNNEDLNQNVQPTYPEVEQPVDVQTPQVEEFNPVAPVEAVTPVEETVEPVIEAPVVETAEEYAEPVVEAPVVENVEMFTPPTYETPVEEYTEPVVEAPVVENVEMFTPPTYEAPVEENTEPVVEAPVVENTEMFTPPTYEAPVEEYTEPEEVTSDLNNVSYIEEANSFAEAMKPTIEPQEEFTEPEPTFETPVEEETVQEEVPAPVEDTEEDEIVREIKERYNRLQELEINVHLKEKELARLEDETQAVRDEIVRNQDEINSLKKVA